MPRPLRVLLLDDCHDAAQLALHELRRAGFRPVGERVETRADFIGRLDPALDLILADYRLPQFNAMCALRLMRELDLDVPVIVVTGAMDDEAGVECIKEGACDYLFKDRLARLGPAVARALELKQVSVERRRSAAALRESEARKTAILETAADGIISTDERGIVESLNPMAERLFGYAAHEVIGQNVGMLMPFLDREENGGDLDTHPTARFKRIIGSSREEEAIARLRRQGQYGDSPRPDLILLDLNLPRKDGREVLAEIKADPALRSIPVVVLSTSSADLDINMSYDPHANCYLTKPVELDAFITVVQAINSFWLQLVQRPSHGG